MSGSLAGLIYLQVVYVALGAGLLPLLGIAGRPGRPLAPGLGLAYMVGIAAAGILSAHLALLDVAVGSVELTVLAILVLVAGLYRARGSLVAQSHKVPAASRGATAWARLAAVACAAVASAVLMVEALRAFAVRPLLEFDGWAIWAMKARALYEFGGTDARVFQSPSYPPLQHPILFPSLEAVAFRALGALDTALVHVQLGLLAVAFALALATLLRGVAPPAATALTILALLTATPVLKQLGSNLADIPLAFFVALGVVGLARWARTGETLGLVCGALFLGAGTLTKSEGMMFALCAFLALAGALGVARAPRQAWRGALLAAGAVVLLALPWRLYVAVHHLPVAEYRFSNLADPGYLSDHADRVGPVAGGLLDRILSGDWGLLVPLMLLALVAALVARSYALAVFSAGWLGLSYLGLVAVYWISNLPVQLALHWSGDRTITTVVIGGAALAPLLVAQAWPAPRREPLGGRPSEAVSAASAGMRRTPASGRRAS